MNLGKMTFTQFESLCQEKGLKEDGTFSKRKQREFLRSIWSEATTGHVEGTYYHACKSGQIIPDLQEHEAKNFLAIELRHLADLGLIPESYVPEPGTLNDFFGAADEESF